MSIPRPEYPRPQMVREKWINLNGEWEFEIDFGKTGRERGLPAEAHLKQRILVPFCPESKLSGIEYKDFMNAVWYKRCFKLEKLLPNYRILLHFEAVDHFCEVWINGVSVGTHTGGYTPFSVDITQAAKEGENLLTVYAQDDCRDPMQPSGKQSETFKPNGAFYTRTTGIWQTVWLEVVNENHIRAYRCNTDVDNGSVHFEVSLNGDCSMKKLTTTVLYQGKVMACSKKKVCKATINLVMDMPEVHLWEPGKGELYDVAFVLENETGVLDSVSGYFGIRCVELAEKAILINHKPVFQRLVLDQGFYRDGIYTAPSDAHLKRDIELSMAMGFNGARLHERVFERRFLYWADKMGYLVWGEYANWGLNHSVGEALCAMLEPWLEAVARDYNSPALIGWCPFNETWDYKGHVQNNRVISGIYYATKAADHTRPVIDTSGHTHVVTDIFDVHDYNQDPEVFAANYEPMRTGGPAHVNFPAKQQYRGGPYFVSEYGGILWNEDGGNGWGYGNAPQTMEEYEQRYCSMAKTLLDNPNICALCFTQLYDVEQEKNGIYTYDREHKFPPDMISRMVAAMTAPAAIEK